MYDIIALGRACFALMTVATLGSVTIYSFVLLMDAAVHQQDCRELYNSTFARWTIIFIGIFVIFFMVGILVLATLFFRLTTYRSRGPDICPFSLDSTSTLRGGTHCGVTGADLHASAVDACNPLNGYSQFGKYGFKVDMLCAELNSSSKWSQNEDVFIHTFLWNSVTTEYKHLRDSRYFTLLDQATAAYCHKGMAWKLRADYCGPPWTGGNATSVGQQLCPAAMHAALEADECQGAKKADVEACFHHCAGDFVLSDSEMGSRPGEVVLGAADWWHTPSQYLVLVLSIFFGIVVPWSCLSYCFVRKTRQYNIKVFWDKKELLEQTGLSANGDAAQSSGCQQF